MVDIRQLTFEDLDFAASQTNREGWWSGRADFELYLDHDPDGCFVACEGGCPIGVVTTTRYATSGWIGNLIVVPRHRSRGVGRALMERGLAHLEAAGCTTVRLDGDPPGIPLYRSLGFVDEWDSLRFRGAGRRLDVVRQPSDLEVEEITAANGGPCTSHEIVGALIEELDRIVFGDERGRLLGMMLGRADRTLIARRSEAPVGYLMRWRTDRGLRFGPGAALDAEAAEALLTAAVAAVPGTPLSIGVPAADIAAVSVLERRGFEPRPPSLRMVRGPLAAEGNPEHVLAIANGALG